MSTGGVFRSSHVVFGASIQNAIYIAGSGVADRAEDWEAKAEEVLDAGAFGYIAGGAGGESTMRANLAASSGGRCAADAPRQRRARHLRRGARRALGGAVSPRAVGVLSIAHAEGEVAWRARSSRERHPVLLSSAASHSIEEIAAAMGDAPRWFQLYW